MLVLHLLPPCLNMAGGREGPVLCTHPHTIPSRPVPSLPFPHYPFSPHPIPSDPIRSHPTPSHPIPSPPPPPLPVPHTNLTQLPPNRQERAWSREELERLNEQWQSRHDRERNQRKQALEGGWCTTGKPATERPVIATNAAATDWATAAAATDPATTTAAAAATDRTAANRHTSQPRWRGRTSWWRRRRA